MLGAKVGVEAWKPVRALLRPGKGDADLDQSGSVWVKIARFRAYFEGRTNRICYRLG